MIRPFTEKDLETAKEIHRANELPEGCLPQLNIEVDGRTVPNPLFIINAVYEHQGVPAMMAFCKMQGELFLLLNHEVGTPDERWQWLLEFKGWFALEAWKLGLEQLSAWLPEEIDKSFAKRMEGMGFKKSPYVCWTLNL